MASLVQLSCWRCAETYDAQVHLVVARDGRPPLLRWSVLSPTQCSYCQAAEDPEILKLRLQLLAGSESILAVDPGPRAVKPLQALLDANLDQKRAIDQLATSQPRVAAVLASLKPASKKDFVVAVTLLIGFIELLTQAASLYLRTASDPALEPRAEKRRLEEIEGQCVTFWLQNHSQVVIILPAEPTLEPDLRFGFS